MCCWRSLGQQMSVPPTNWHTKLLCGSLGNSGLTYCLSLQCQQEGKQPIMSVWRICVCLYRFFFNSFFLSLTETLLLFMLLLYHILWLSDTRKLENLMLHILLFYLFSQCQFWPAFFSIKWLELEILVTLVSLSHKTLEFQLSNIKVFCNVTALWNIAC